MLTREFISSSLYAQSVGYFNSNVRVFQSSSPQAIPFRACVDRNDYRRRLAELYETYPSCWVTPVELFKPFYGQAIARWILETRRGELGPASVPKKVHPEADGAVHLQTPEEAAQQAKEEAEAARAEQAAIAKARASASSSSSKLPTAAPLAPLRIIEMGGGNGTCALNILDYLEKHYPTLYAQTEYTIVELSEVCARRQKDVLRRHARNHLSYTPPPNAAPAADPNSRAHLPRVRLLHMSMISWREVVSDPSVFVLGLEVLDNMPHDRLRYTGGGVGSAGGELQQCHVFTGASAGTSAGSVSGSGSSLRESKYVRYHEVTAPVSDPWIMEYGGYWSELQNLPNSSALVRPALFSVPPGSQAHKEDERSVIFANARAAFLRFTGDMLRGIGRGVGGGKSGSHADDRSEWFPTTSLQLLHVLRHYIPGHHVLLADFSMLPPTVSGTLGPVVSSKGAETNGRALDHATYLVAQGTADIFFPTDFAALHYVYQRVCMERKPEQVTFEGNGIVPASTGAAAAPTDDWAAAATTSATTSPPLSGARRNQPRVLTTYEFMQRYAKGYELYTTTQEGWSPMHRDYLNMAFFIA